MARALDAVARDAAGDLRIRGSILWPLVGAVQLAIGAVFAFAIAWYVTLFVSGGRVPVSTVEAPLLGPLPLPLVLLVGIDRRQRGDSACCSRCTPAGSDGASAAASRSASEPRLPRPWRRPASAASSASSRLAARSAE